MYIFQNIAMNKTRNVHLMSNFQPRISDNIIYQPANILEFSSMLLLIYEMQYKYHLWPVSGDFCHHVPKQIYRGPGQRKSQNLPVPIGTCSPHWRNNYTLLPEEITTRNVEIMLLVQCIMGMRKRIWSPDENYIFICVLSCL